MREKLVRSYVGGRRSENSKDSLFLSAESGSSKYDLSLGENVAWEDRELKDACSLIEVDDLVEVVKATVSSKPFSAFGSFRQRYGGGLDEARRSGVRTQSGVGGMSSEAPAKLGSDVVRRGNMSQDRPEPNRIEHPKEPYFMAVLTAVDTPSRPIDISRERSSHVDNKVHRRVQKQRSFSTDIDREEAWERKRDLYSTDEFGHGVPRARPVARSVSDCGDRTWPTPIRTSAPRTITRSLTDEDLEELRGCIDLGFGFSHDESCDLRSTLPALELYCAINRQSADIRRSRSSPVSPLDGNTLDRTSSGGSPRSPISDTWRISSPGDHPSQVKTRLRHWAQAVACSVKQGF